MFTSVSSVNLCTEVNLDSDVVAQEENREFDKILSIDEYFKTRCHDVGALLAFAIGRIHLDIPAEVLYHPVIRDLERLGAPGDEGLALLVRTFAQLSTPVLRSGICELSGSELWGDHGQ